jgi:hypothetical protein
MGLTEDILKEQERQRKIRLIRERDTIMLNALTEISELAHKYIECFDLEMSEENEYSKKCPKCIANRAILKALQVIS